ncbi:MAG: hypothetical protein HOI47_25225 [Candidatus Scalindua sp.]|jgi:hypothetical protein|nr:hypothetical protein [Candidatus Scalindua sp.]
MSDEHENDTTHYSPGIKRRALTVGAKRIKSEVFDIVKSKPFQDGVRDIFDKCNIPVGGFHPEESHAAWKQSGGITADVEHEFYVLAKKFNLFQYQSPLREFDAINDFARWLYLCHAHRSEWPLTTDDASVGDVCYLSHSKDDLTYARSEDIQNLALSNFPISLHIRADASLGEIKSFLDAVYSSEITKLQKEYLNSDKKKKRTRVKRDRDNAIFKLYMDGYKPREIKVRLQEIGFKEVVMPHEISAVVYREKKKRKYDNK